MHKKDLYMVQNETLIQLNRIYLLGCLIQKTLLCSAIIAD